ncbi:MAG: hypothetical protein EBU08_20670, partial [Micrococcales bacterium]|nr:hypothetical protein [Micrococcales bacterium]
MGGTLDLTSTANQCRLYYASPIQAIAFNVGDNANGYVATLNRLGGLGVNSITCDGPNQSTFVGPVEFRGAVSGTGMSNYVTNTSLTSTLSSYAPLSNPSFTGVLTSNNDATIKGCLYVSGIKPTALGSTPTVCIGVDNSGAVGIEMKPSLFGSLGYIDIGNSLNNDIGLGRFEYSSVTGEMNFYIGGSKKMTLRDVTNGILELPTGTLNILGTGTS